MISESAIINIIDKAIEEQGTQRLNELNNWREWQKEANRKVVLFGASEMGEKCCACLEELGILVDYFCDNNSTKHRLFTTPKGKRIKVDFVEKVFNTDSEVLCFITTGYQHLEAVKKQLSQYNVSRIVSEQYLNFYLETLIQLEQWGIEGYKGKVRELFDFYEDDRSKEILWCHFKFLFGIKDTPEELASINFVSLCERPQYFLEGGRYLGKQHTMIDCGAYTGDTVEDLIYKTDYRDFDSYECFEMDETNFMTLKETISNLPDMLREKVHAHNVGVGESEAILTYSFNNDCSSIAANGDRQTRILRLDDICKDKQVSFIKMDIEGSEQSALRGAKNLISENKPMCAICIYHEMKAFWEIPQILKQYVPEYRFMLRHHSTVWDDTVCYAML